MTNARNKKQPAARTRTPKNKTTNRKKQALGSGWKRTLSAFALAAAGSFQIASCSLNPQWSAEKAAERAASALLSSLGLPALQQLRKPAGQAQAPRQEPAGAAPPAAADRNTGTATGFAHCPQFFPGGQPPVLQTGGQRRELCFSGFAVLHDGASKTPVFVAERLNRELVQQAQAQTRTNKFYADARLPRAERAELDDYKRSGYARGHMAPAGDMYSADAMAQSFSLANMVPQDQKQNSGPWSQVEQATRKYAQRAKGDVYVFTGPVFEAPVQTIGAGRVHVPSHIFKLVYDAASGRSWVYWQANSPDTQMGPPISYEEFTRRTGMPLLSRVANHQKI